MDDATFTSDAAAINRHKLLEQLAIIRSLFRKESSVDDAATAAAVARNRNVVEGRAKEGVRLINDQMAAVSTELLLTVMSDMMLLRLLDGLGLEEGRAVSSDALSPDQQQLMDDAAAKKKKRVAAAAKKKRYKRNKAAAAAKDKKTELISWLGGGIIAVIMMVAFSFITTPIVTITLIQPSDGSGEGKAPPALPPSASKILRQEDLKPNDEVSTSPADIIISPLAAVVPPPIFAPTAVSNRRMKSDEMRASTCFDTPNWEDFYGRGCDYYGEWYEGYYVCPYTDKYAGDKGPASKHCCHCGGGSHSLTPTNSPTISNSPTKSANPSTAPSISHPPTISANPSTVPSTAPSTCTETKRYDGNGYACGWYEVMDDPGCPKYGDLYNSRNSSPTITIAPSLSSTSAGCIDTPGWKDINGEGCGYYYTRDPGCPRTDWNAGKMGPASQNCCYCKNPSCQDYSYRSKCHEMMIEGDYRKDEACAEAEISCCEAADHDVKIVTRWGPRDELETVGLYNECKCNFWLRLCEDTRVGEACDYAAEYCCGDYKYIYGGGFKYRNSPTCYCDFFHYAQNEFGHTLKPKAMNIDENFDKIDKEFDNPCWKLQDIIADWKLEGVDFIRERENLGSLSEFERQSLEAMYNRTNGQNWTNKAGWMNETVDHCQWYGITCESDGFVSGIDLRDNNLAGQFPVYTRITYDGEIYLENDWMMTKYGLANLYNLKSLDLADNKLTGTIDYRPLYNLYVLTHFDVSGNQLSGEVDALVTPLLTYADFHNNLFTSMRRFEKYEVSPLQTLRFCDVSNNAIKNEASDFLEDIPPNIQQFFASNNLIYGSLPELLDNIQKLRQFDMSSNALTGSLPGFTESFATLQTLDMSNQTNGFIGSIPDNIWRSLSLQTLNLADNRLTGSIPSLVGNLALLEVFDLTNNLVKGSIPSEIGMLEGSLKHLRLSNNVFTGSIPSDVGRLQGASVILAGNTFDDSSTAPLGLCTLRSVNEFDLVNDTELCPVERNALSDFYDSTKGAEWTDSTDWLDEYKSFCDWKGVNCDQGRVTKLELSNNGLSGRLRKSIGNLTFIKVLDLSDNDIKGSIPTEVGLLSNLTFLRLSYNAFTGTAEGLRELTKLQLLHLQSNRITGMPIMTQLDMSNYNKSTFVTDCGVPSAFEETPECQNCTMCCNANDDCYPAEDTLVAKMGQTYGSFAAVCLAGFIVLCCMAFLLFYFFGKRKNRGNAQTMSAERRLEEDDKYALSRIGKESVYSYFVTEKPVGWLAAFVTLGIQVGILVFFVMASEANLQKDTIDIQFTWKCPRDSDVCKDKADLTKAGWVIFSLLMIAFLAKDMINGCKLIYHSSKVWHTIGARIRYFIGGICLCSITLFALYVSTVYNRAIATSNTDIIVNSVVVLFIMEIDEYIFAALKASNKKWTAHAEESEDSSLVTEVSEMKEEFELQRAQIASQQEQITAQQKELKKLREMVEKMLWETAW